MNEDNLKIGACIMVHNMAPLLVACIKSLQWVDGIYLFDDLSSDDSLKIAKQSSIVPLVAERSNATNVAFEKGEELTRNYVIEQAFEKLNSDIMIIIDADELLSELCKEQIISAFKSKEVKSISLSMWHLYDEKRYLHFWQTTINNVSLIDPHTRIIRKGEQFQSNIADGSHPIINATKKTVCLHKPLHFHLKYFHKSTLPNYSLYFLPEKIYEEDVKPYLRNLPFLLPKDIKDALSLVKWEAMSRYTETPHYASERIFYSDPREALIHPKDRK